MNSVETNHLGQVYHEDLKTFLRVEAWTHNLVVRPIEGRLRVTISCGFKTFSRCDGRSLPPNEMFLEILIAIGIGIICGTCTGLIPGIHVNLVSVILVSLSPFLLQFIDPLSLALIIIAMALTHTFVDTIPSIFLGAPDPSVALSILPGHQMLLNGKGFEAVKLTVIGSLFSLLLTVALFPFTIFLFPKIYPILRPNIGYLLLAISAYMIYSETTKQKRIHGTLIFLLSGTLGYIVLNAELNQPLFPLLSGLFGTSLLLISLKNKIQIPKQTITNHIWMGRSGLTKATFAATICGSITGLLPGLGSSQAAILAMTTMKNIGQYTFLVVIGGINTVNFASSLATWLTLNKARNGAIVAIREFMNAITIDHLFLFAAALLIIAGAATYITLSITEVFSKYITKIPYTKVCIGITLFIAVLSALFDQMVGLLVLLTSTFLGVAAQLSGIKKSLLMGCIILPVISYFI